MISPKNKGFQYIKIKLYSTTWMTLECSVVIFQALENMWDRHVSKPIMASPAQGQINNQCNDCKPAT